MKKKFMTVFASMMILIAVQGFGAPPGVNSAVKKSSLFSYSDAQHLAVAWDIGSYTADKPIYQPQIAQSIQRQQILKEEDTGPAAINVNSLTVDRTAACSIYSADVTAVKQKTKATVSREGYIRDIAVFANNNSASREKANNIRSNTAGATA